MGFIDRLPLFIAGQAFAHTGVRDRVNASANSTTVSYNAFTLTHGCGGDSGDGYPNIKAALEDALHDEDANVRAQAISTLTHRGDTKDESASAIQQALQDSSADVRLMAVDGIGDDIKLLQQAINDSDEAVRMTAELKLAELMQQKKINNQSR